jgi:protein TonB
VVYQNGKVIFQQTSPRGPERSVTSLIAGNPGANPSPKSGNATEAAPIAVSSQVASAHLLQRVEPIYPEEARRRYIQGEVVLEAVVGKDGSVQELRLISGDSQLAAAAAAAVRQWRFRPYEQRGKPADFSTRLTVNFRLH